MTWNEIEVPKELREFMLEGAEETALGKRNGSSKQYRYGNLHIREYDDKFLVHMDKIDPRENPFGHLLFDAPEFLVGVACAALGGTKLASNLFQNDFKNSKQNSVFASLLSSLAAGYTGYTITKKLKDTAKGESS